MYILRRRDCSLGFIFIFFFQIRVSFALWASSTEDVRGIKANAYRSAHAEPASEAAKCTGHAEIFASSTFKYTEHLLPKQNVTTKCYNIANVIYLDVRSCSVYIAAFDSQAARSYRYIYIYIYICIIY